MIASKLTPGPDVVDLASAAHEAGFDDLGDYREWLRLDGGRLLNLSLRQEADRQAEMFDRGGELDKPVALAVATHGEVASRLSRGIDRCLRLYRWISPVGLAHSLAPSSDGSDVREPMRSSKLTPAVPASGRSEGPAASAPVAGVAGQPRTQR